MNEKNRMITANSDEQEAVKKLQHTATISLAIILGQMWQEHKTVDHPDRPVEFAISLRSLVPEGKTEAMAHFRAEAMWQQTVNGEAKVFHAHGPAFSAEDLNKGVNITAVFRKLAEGIKQRQQEIDEQGGIAP